MVSGSIKLWCTRYGAALMVLWTAIICSLLGSVVYSHHGDTLKEAENTARDFFQLNQLYRSWCADLGGVYAPIERVVPNQYLQSPRRDLDTTDGQRLTLINPAYMTRLVFVERARQITSPISIKMLSLRPLNPANAPDAEERAALLYFDRGGRERTDLISLKGKPYLRFIARFSTEKPCLECHAAQGYRLGDTRGGIAITVPLTGYYLLERKSSSRMLGGYLILWVVGCAGIAVTSRRRADYEAKVRAGEEKFRTVCEWTQDWDYWAAPDGSITYISPSSEAITGYPTKAFYQDPELALRLVHPQDREAYQAHVSVARPSADQISSLDFRIVARDGTIRWMHHSCRPIYFGTEYRGRRISNRDITERKYNEQELRLRGDLLNLVGDSVLVCNPDGEIVESNEAGWRSRGYTRQEFIGLNIRDITTSAPETVRDRLQFSLSEGCSAFEAVHLSRDGSTSVVEVFTRAIDYDGRPAILHSIRDISRRKEAEEGLRKSERLNASMHRVSTVFLAGHKKSDLYRELLAMVLDILESPAGLVGHLDDLGDLKCPGQESTERSILHRAEGLWRGALQARTLLVSPGDVLLDGGAPGIALPLLVRGEPIGMLLVAERSRDYDAEDRNLLTAIAEFVAPVLKARLERQRAVAALEENEHKLRVLFDVIQSGIIELDVEGRVQFANQRMAEMLGLPLDELIGSLYLDRVAAGQRDAAAANLLGLLRGESQSVFCERFYQRKDGSSFWGYLTARKLESPDGRGPSLVGTVTDMTELKLAEEKRLRMEQQMLHVQKLESLGVLAGGIAHDFNNILTAILGNASLALHKLPSGSGAQDNLQRIESAACKAADLARQMLAYSGKGHFVLDLLDMNDLVREMTSMLEVSISKKVALQFRPEIALPRILADPTQLQQVVMNLTINASEAVGEASGLIAIRTGSKVCGSGYFKDDSPDATLPAGNYVFLEVSDTGCGMDRDTQRRIFEPFFTTKFTGRGLGMAAILGIIRGHRGAIKVYSEPGQGSTFRVYFPASGHQRGPEVVKGVEEHWSGSGTVLLVDDEESVRNVGTAMLRNLGFAVLCAADGREALAVFRERREEISLVLMDLTMPNLGGEETFHELRSIDPNVEVILSSGYSEHEVTRRFLGKGISGFVQKPYTLATLREILGRLELRRIST